MLVASKAIDLSVDGPAMMRRACAIAVTIRVPSTPGTSTPSAFAISARDSAVASAAPSERVTECVRRS